MAVRTRRDVLVLGATALAGGCGYALAGRGNNLPAHIRSIGVPLFENQSTTPDVDIVLTEAVRQELQGKGGYTILPQDTGVDALLDGRVVNVVLQPSAFTAENQVSSYLIIATASVEFTDLQSKETIWANPSFQARDEFVVTTGESATDPTALFAQDTTALDRLAQTFARSIVTSIFEAF